MCLNEFKCNECGWTGPEEELVKGYVEFGEGESECLAECPGCGSDDVEEYH